MRAIGFFLILFLLSWKVHAQAQREWIVNWKSSQGESGSVPVRMITNQDGARSLMVLAMPSPISNLSTAVEEESGERTPVAVRSKEGTSYLLLTRAHGVLTMTDSQEKSVQIQYELTAAPEVLRVTSSCQRWGVRIDELQKKNPLFPALVTCQGNGSELTEVVFSTLTDAEWFGSDLFETEGKGERWKVFAAKEALSAGSWEMIWGDATAKNVVRLAIAKPVKNNPTKPQPSLRTQVGLQYVNGTVKKREAEAPVGGLQIPVSVLYQSEGSWWSVGGQYNFFLHSLEKGNDDKDNTTSDLRLWGGADYNGGSWLARLTLGYLSRRIDAPSIGIRSTFEAPQAGAEIHYGIQDIYGFFFNQAQIDSEGEFTEKALGLFYQGKLLMGREARLWVMATQVQAVQQHVELQGNWLHLGLSIQF
ncbi:hypothetical protein [Bdellovibrio sp.]|uniref:hypothetical protein n=1 Tax=Bdellovibrio sp. TaxID=28201 RepID=UPI0039E5C882